MYRKRFWRVRGARTSPHARTGLARHPRWQRAVQSTAVPTSRWALPFSRCGARRCVPIYTDGDSAFGRRRDHGSRTSPSTNLWRAISPRIDTHSVRTRDIFELLATRGVFLGVRIGDHFVHTLQPIARGLDDGQMSCGPGSSTQNHRRDIGGSSRGSATAFPHTNQTYNTSSNPSHRPVRAPRGERSFTLIRRNVERPPAAGRVKANSVAGQCAIAGARFVSQRPAALTTAQSRVLSQASLFRDPWRR